MAMRLYKKYETVMLVIIQAPTVPVLLAKTCCLRASARRNTRIKEFRLRPLSL